jgi:hypothetical protein
VGVWRGFSRAFWLGLQPGAVESGDVLLAQSLRLPAAHGRDGGDIGSAGAILDLDDPDDFGYGYLAQTIFSMFSAEVLGGMSDQSSVAYCSFDSVFPLAIASECSVADRI